MTIQQQRMTCACGHVFEADLVMDAPVAVALASMKAVRCPSCGGRKVYLGGAYDDAPPLSASVWSRALWWRKRGETGTSSLTIHQAFLGRVYAQARWPHDTDDYRRCRALFDLIPEWRTDLSPILKACPWMKPLVDRWDEFDRLYDACNLDALYLLLRVSGAEAEDLRAKGGTQ